VTGKSDYNNDNDFQQKKKKESSSLVDEKKRGDYRQADSNRYEALNVGLYVIQYRTIDAVTSVEGLVAVVRGG
jgi:hypothetical protein